MVEEVHRLINELDISGDHAEEIINIYFEFFDDMKTYVRFLNEDIRVIRETEENMDLIAELQTIDGACIYEGDDYVLLTNYNSLVKYNEIGDCIPNSL